jgi:hypothetical protein
MTQHECDGCQRLKLVVGVTRKYYMSLAVELAGLLFCALGFCCNRCIGVAVSATNIGDSLTRGGALFVAFGSLIFAKIIKWDEHLISRDHNHKQEKE